MVRRETANSNRLRCGFNALRSAKNARRVGIRTLQPESNALECPCKRIRGACNAETAGSNAVGRGSKGEQLAVRTEIAGSNRVGCA